jgi:hypothetical protein
MTKRPNVLLIVAGGTFSSPVDYILLFLANIFADLGYSDVGCFGSEIRTPNIDRIAREGMLFTDCESTTYQAKLLLAEADTFPKYTRPRHVLQLGLW